ncbi:MAG: hypothetical protein IKN14_01815 [Clostridiales bacterium]|nr:hypothetical protein [Clostridiales bacterium]
MHDYKRLAQMISPISEKDLILFEMSADDKAHVVKQFNRALINCQKDGTDVAQIILKPLISDNPSWGDCALVYALCLAREGIFKRAESALEYAVNNTLSSGQNLSIAQEAMKYVKDDINNPEPKPETPRSGRNWTSIVSENGGTNERVGMQAPILTRASSGHEKMGMASEKERRDIMMRSASVGDERTGDDIEIESPRTPADNMRIIIRVVTVIVILALLGILVYFVIIPTVSKVRNSADTEKRLDYLIGALDDHKGDPEVDEIIKGYADEFGTKTKDNKGKGEENKESDAPAEGTDGSAVQSDAAQSSAAAAPGGN